MPSKSSWEEAVMAEGEFKALAKSSAGLGN